MSSILLAKYKDACLSFFTIFSRLIINHRELEQEELPTAISMMPYLLVYCNLNDKLFSVTTNIKK
jgi:hypothetical protein